MIARDDPRRPDVVALLEEHLAFSRAHSPPEDVYALDLDGLLDPAVSFFSARTPALVAIGALKRLDASHAELKSMHTAHAVRGQGYGRKIVAHLLDVARAQGFTRVSLETGSLAAYVPARTLYASFGFTPCPPFGSYRASPNSVCMTLSLPSNSEV